VLLLVLLGLFVGGGLLSSLHLKKLPIAYGASN